MEVQSVLNYSKPQYISNINSSMNYNSTDIVEDNNSKKNLYIGLTLLSLATLGASLIHRRVNSKPIKSFLKQEAAWFKEYKSLCKQFGAKVREVGVTGGAADHYEELLLRANNPVEYQKYLKNRKMRALTEDKARILEELDKALK